MIISYIESFVNTYLRRWCTFRCSYLYLHTFLLLFRKKFDKFRHVEFFIQAAGLAYHRRTKCGVYHQGRRAALVSHHASACILLRLIYKANSLCSQRKNSAPDIPSTEFFVLCIGYYFISIPSMVSLPVVSGTNLPYTEDCPAG